MNGIRRLARRSLLARLIVTLVPMATLPLIFFGQFALRNHTASLREQGAELHKALMDSIGDDFDRKFLAMSAALRVAAKNEVLRAQNLFLLKDTLANLRAFTPDFWRLSYVDTSWNVVTSDPPLPNEDGKPLAGGALTRELAGVPAGTLARDGKGRLAIHMASPVYGVDGTLVGYVVGFADLDGWAKAAAKSLGLNGGLLGGMFTDDGSPIFFGRLPEVGVADGLAAMARHGKVDGWRELAWHGQTYLLTERELKTYPGSILLAQRESDLYGAIHRTMWTYGAVTLSLVILLNVLLLRVARGISRPLELIGRAAAAFQRGKYDVRLGVDRQDELGRLAKAFNEMGAALAKSRKQAAEIALAETVHSSMQNLKSVVNDKTRVATFYRPAQNLGGDWFGFLEDKTTKALYVLLGDVTGHGLAQGLVTSAMQGAMAVIESMMNDPVRRLSVMPSEIVQLLDRTLRTVLTDSNLQMTCVVARFDFARSELVYCNGGHTFPYLLRDSGRSLEAHHIATTAQPILGAPAAAGQPEPTEYKDSTMALKAGDVVVFYTDGLTEARDHEGQQFRRSLFRSLRKLRELGTSEQVRDLIQSEFETFTRATEPQDDVCLLVVEMVRQQRERARSDGAA